MSSLNRLRTLAAALSLTLTISVTAWGQRTAQPAPDPPPLPVMSAPFVAPTAIAFSSPTPIFVTIQITDMRLLGNSINLNRVDSNGNIISRLGNLKDDGTGGDVVAGDGIFSGTFTVSESTNDLIGLRVSAAFRGFLQRVQSDVFTVNVLPGLTVLNADKDFWALNMGGDGVAFNFADVPSNATELKISRSNSASGPWTVVVDVPYSDDLPQPLLDAIDGTQADYYYQLQALSVAGGVLKTWVTLFVPHFHVASQGSAQLSTAALAEVRERPASPYEMTPRFSTLAAIPPGVNPIVNTAFITDAIFEDAQAMTAYQVRDLFEEKGSYLATNTIDDTINDTDGVAFSPAKTIAQLASTYMINPQLILVSLQKESQLVTSPTLPKKPKDGWMGAKGCSSQTIRGQLDCGISRFRTYLMELDSNGQTISGWKVGVAKTTSDKIPVTPINRAVCCAIYLHTVGRSRVGRQCRRRRNGS